nr:hypothetical protein [Microbulbifer sp. VAAF005]
MRAKIILQLNEGMTYRCSYCTENVTEDRLSVEKPF